MDIYIGNHLCTHRAIIYKRSTARRALSVWLKSHPGTAYELVDLGTNLAIYW